MFGRIAARFRRAAWTHVGSRGRVETAIQSAFACLLNGLFPAPFLSFDGLLMRVGEIGGARIGPASIGGHWKRLTLLKAGARGLFQRHAVTLGKPARRIQGIRTLAFELAGVCQLEKVAKPGLFC